MICQTFLRCLREASEEWCMQAQRQVACTVLGTHAMQESALLMPLLTLQDLICNWLGNQRWVDAMPWSGHAEWQTTPAQNWSGGSIKQVGPLSFVKVASAGHMVPMDVPAASLKMIEAFITDSDLADCHPQHAGQAQLSIS